LLATALTRMNSVQTASGRTHSMNSFRNARLVNPCIGASISGVSPIDQGSVPAAQSDPLPPQALFFSRTSGILYNPPGHHYEPISFRLPQKNRPARRRKTAPIKGIAANRSKVL
jgi:hypothetical protein